MSRTKLWRIALVVPEAHAPAFAEAVGDHADAVSTFELEEGGNWLVEATVYGEPDAPRLTARVAILAEAVGIPESRPVPSRCWWTPRPPSAPASTARPRAA